MSLWTKIRGPLELAAGAAAAYFVGPEVLGAFASSGGAAAAAGGAEAAAAGGGELAMATAEESAGMGALFASNPAPAYDAGLLSGAAKPANPYLGPAAQAVGALGSAGLAAAGQVQTNAANAQQAQQQMDFQEQMSSTAYQRATADMKAAGLNPMLAYGQGGASTPSGAQAVMGNAAGQGVSSANQSLQVMGQLENLFAQGENIQAQTDNTKADTANKLLQGPLITEQTGRENASAYQLRRQGQSTEAGLKGVLADSDVKENTVDSRTALARSDADFLALKARLAGLEIPGAENEARFERSPLGQNSPAIRFGLTSAQQAKNFFNPFK